MRLRLTAAFVVGLATPAVAQSVPATPAVATAAPTVATTAPPAAKPEEPAGYTYQGGGRRDPFVSLLRKGSDEKRPTDSARPPGLAGLGADEVTLKGTVRGQNGFVAMVEGADRKTYIVRAGDRLLDGVIRSIAPDSLTIVQQVNDPLSTQKQRDVRKMLRQTEEGK